MRGSSMRRRGLGSVVCVLTAVAVTQLVCVAAMPPSHDACANAASLGLVNLHPVTAQAEWALSTLEGHESCSPDIPAVADVWHTVTAVKDGLLRVDLCGGLCHKLHVSVYSNYNRCDQLSSSGLGLMVCDSVMLCDCGNPEGVAVFEARGGETYLLRVWSNIPPPMSQSMYTIRVQPYTPPSNTQCIAALELTPNTATPASTVFALGPSGYCSNEGYRHEPATWYRFTVPAGSHNRLSTCGSSDADATLAMWQGTPAELCDDLHGHAYKCNLDFCGTEPGFVFDCSSSDVSCSYLVRLSGVGGVEVNTVLDLQSSSPTRYVFAPVSGTGNWSSTASYTQGAVPGAVDHLTIGAGATAVLDVDASIGHLDFQDGASLLIPAGRVLTVLQRVHRVQDARPTCRILIEGRVNVASATAFDTTCDVVIRDGRLDFGLAGSLKNQPDSRLHINWPGALVLDGPGVSTVTSSGAISLLVASVSWTEGSVDIDGSLRVYGYQTAVEPPSRILPEPADLRVSNITRAADDVTVRTFTGVNQALSRVTVYGNASIIYDWNGVFENPASGVACFVAYLVNGKVTIASGTTIRCGTDSEMILSDYGTADPDWLGGAVHLEQGAVLDIDYVKVFHGYISGSGVLVYRPGSTLSFSQSGLSPGLLNDASEPRHLIVDGPSSLDWGSYRFHLGGRVAGKESSLIDFTNAASIAGKSVTVTIDDGYLPDQGQVFLVMRSNATLTGVLNTDVNGTLQSECARVVPVYGTEDGADNELRVRVEQVFCCGITTCTQCTGHDGCVWCPDSGAGAHGSCVDVASLAEEEEAQCYALASQCSGLLLLAQVIALGVLVLSLGLASYVYLRSRLTSRRSRRKQNKPPDQLLDT